MSRTSTLRLQDVGHRPGLLTRLPLIRLAAVALRCALRRSRKRSRSIATSITDGRVVYSDKPPPANAKNAQAKRIGRNSIETSESVVCHAAGAGALPGDAVHIFAAASCATPPRALLNKRGVPHTVVDVCARRRRRSTEETDQRARRAGAAGRRSGRDRLQRRQVAEHADRRRLSENTGAANSSCRTARRCRATAGAACHASRLSGRSREGFVPAVIAQSLRALGCGSQPRAALSRSSASRHARKTTLSKRAGF